MASSKKKKMKRKDLEFDVDHVSDDFYDFSLSSPARKIRRLDLGLPPIIEEAEEADMGLDVGRRVYEVEDGGQGFVELPNEEKAIVLFNPMPHSVSSYSISPGLISDLKHQAIWHNRSRPIIVEIDDDDEEGESINKEDKNTCLAVVPWTPSQGLIQEPDDQSKTSLVEQQESMEAEEMEVDAMEIEETNMDTGAGQANQFGSLVSGNESMHHLWQQQHCMIPQPPLNVPAPVVWYR